MSVLTNSFQSEGDHNGSMDNGGLLQIHRGWPVKVEDEKDDTGRSHVAMQRFRYSFYVQWHRKQTRSHSGCGDA